MTDKIEKQAFRAELKTIGIYMLRSLESKLAAQAKRAQSQLSMIRRELKRRKRSTPC